MNDNVTVRLARRGDIDSIAGFNVAMAHETEDKDLPPDRVCDGVRRLFDEPKYGFYVVAESGDAVVGCLLITYEWSDWRCGVFWWIQSVYVRSEYRKRGVFSMMHEFLKAAASQERGVCGFRLCVEKTNAVAKSTYEKLGFAEAYYRVYEEEF